MKKKGFILCVIGILLAFAFAAAEGTENRQAQYDRGMEEIAEGNYEDAYAVFSALGHFSDAHEKAYALSAMTKGTLVQLNDHAALLRCFITDEGRKIGMVYGLVNLKTNTVVSPRWSLVKIYADGTLAVQNMKDKKWGLCNDKGTLIFDYNWYRISEKEVDGLLMVDGGSAGNPRLGLVRTDGTIVSACGWLVIGHRGSIEVPDFPCGLVRVEDTRENWGFIDKKGIVRITVKYAYADDFGEDGLAQVTVKEGRKLCLSYIDTQDREAFFENSKYPDIKNAEDDPKENKGL